jgi:hypothetical protein
MSSRTVGGSALVTQRVAPMRIIMLPSFIRLLPFSMTSRISLSERPPFAVCSTSSTSSSHANRHAFILQVGEVQAA